MAQLSNERSASDVAKSIDICAYTDTGHDQASNGSPDVDLASSRSVMQTRDSCTGRALSDMPPSYRELSNRNQFGDIDETHLKNHASHCQYCAQGCVRCTALRVLNSAFGPTELLYNDPSLPITNSPAQMKMPQNAGTTWPGRFSVPYNTPALSSPGNQQSSTPYYTNMRSFEQHGTLFQPPVTPNLSHLSTPNSIFSATRTPPDSDKVGNDWGTPATTVDDDFKVSVNNSKAYVTKQDNQRGILYRGAGQVSDDYDTQLNSIVSGPPQWLQNAEDNDIIYRRGSESAARQQLQTEHVYEQQSIGMATFTDIDNDSLMDPFQVQTTPQPAYVNQEPGLDQEYLTFEPRTYETNHLNFSNPFEQNTTINAYDARSPYNHMNTYQPFDFNHNLYECAEYPVPAAVIPSDDLTSSSNNNQSQRAATSRRRDNHRDNDLDRKLVEWRNQGMSYKEIMAKGNFGLEESTLRGRYRTLTKAKEKRLRKPVWDDYSMNTLMEAVERFAPSTGILSKEGLDKVPWKRVAEWMASERGCYHYGNATVKKKYVETIKLKLLSRRQTTV